MANVSLTTAATAAAQFLGILDSGESLSNQQLLDAQAAANNLLENWYTEQIRIINAIVATFTLAGGTYNAGTAPVFGDLVTPVAFPSGIVRALELGLAIEIAPQYDMTPSAALLKTYMEARNAANPLAAKIVALAPQETAHDQGG